MYDFDAYEAVDELIDEINEEYAVEAAEDAYQQIYEELCERVDCDELTLEEAEIINEAAAEKYLVENGDFKVTTELTNASKELKSLARQASRAFAKGDYDLAEQIIDESAQLCAHIMVIGEKCANGGDNIDLDSLAMAIDSMDMTATSLDQFIDQSSSVNESVLTEGVKIELKAMIKSNPMKALATLKSKFKKSNIKLKRNLMKAKKAIREKAKQAKADTDNLKKKIIKK